MTQEARNLTVAVDEILVDARSLQSRGRPSHRRKDNTAALLTAIRHRAWPHSRPKLIGLVDRGAAPLREHHRLLFDEVTTRRIRPGRRSRWFISPAPMECDPVWLSPILLDPGIFAIAVIRDLISAERTDEQLTDWERRADHLVSLAWLGRYDVFAVASRQIKVDLERVRSVDTSKVFVAGRALHITAQAQPGDVEIPFEERRHIAFMVEGRAQDEVVEVVLAHARSTARERVSLVLFGSCPPETRGELRTVYARQGGDLAALKFAEDLDDRNLRELYRYALLTVIPARGSEVLASSALESMALGTPVVVSEAEQHLDEAKDATLTYAKGDHDALARVFDLAAGNVEFWRLARAAGLREARHHHEDAVARRLLDTIVERARDRPPAPRVIRGRRPDLAILTPLAPAATGAAGRSSSMIEALSRRVDIHVFSDTPDALPGGPITSLAPVHALDFALQRFDATLSVLGNSKDHASIFDYLIENGGAALVHDAQLIGFYSEAYGLDRTLEIGRSEFGGGLTRDLVADWVREQHAMPILFLSEVARAASPLLVTSDVARTEVARLYGVEPKRLPLLQTRTFDRALLAPQARRAARTALGWERDEVVLCSFGLNLSAAAVAIWALRLLHDWRVTARLVLCGPLDSTDCAGLDRLAEELDLVGSLSRVSTTLSERDYARHLIAVDVAVQIETRSLSGPSETLMDCIAAGLPVVSNEHVARCAEAPAFVSRIPDALSPVLLAEVVLDIVSSGHHRTRFLDEAQIYGAAHAPDLYALMMTEALGLDCGPA